MDDLFFEELNEIEDYNKYVKVIYQSEPIGKYNIILELTTFDVEAYENDRNKKILNPIRHYENIDIKEFQASRNLIPDGIIGPATLNALEDYLNDRVDIFYKNELIKMKNTIETSRKYERNTNTFTKNWKTWRYLYTKIRYLIIKLKNFFYILNERW